MNIVLILFYPPNFSVPPPPQSMYDRERRPNGALPGADRFPLLQLENGSGGKARPGVLGSSVWDLANSDLKIPFSQLHDPLSEPIIGPHSPGSDP